MYGSTEIVACLTSERKSDLLDTTRPNSGDTRPSSGDTRLVDVTMLDGLTNTGRLFSLESVNSGVPVRFRSIVPGCWRLREYDASKRVEEHSIAMDAMVQRNNMICHALPSDGLPTLSTRPSADDEARQWSSIVESARPRVAAYVRFVAKDADDQRDLVAEVVSRAWIERAQLFTSADPSLILIQYTRESCSVRAKLMPRCFDGARAQFRLDCSRSLLGHRRIAICSQRGSRWQRNEPNVSTRVWGDPVCSVSDLRGFC